MLPKFWKEAITINGFLPEGEPLKALPLPYYQPWELVIRDMPLLLKQRSFRTFINRMPLLSTEKVTSSPEKRRAYVILAFFASAYVWGGDTPAEILPACVAVPLLDISRQLDIEPIATYTSLNLWNTSSSTNNFSDVESLSSLHTFSGTQDEEWFYVISVAMESEGAKLVHSLLDNMAEISAGDTNAIIAFLEDTKDCIIKLTELLERMYERCDPNVFYYGFRPYLAGSMNMEQAGLSNGVFYSEGEDGEGRWMKLRGGSNGQSPIVQFLDAVLGVKHQSTGTHKSNLLGERRLETKADTTSFHAEMRRYMTGNHQKFLDYIDEVVAIRQLADTPAAAFATEQDRRDHLDLQVAYQAAVQSLTNFRNKHLQIVTRYIVLPAKRGAKGADHLHRVVNLSVPQAPETELTGAGGTTLMPFLKQSRDETLQAGRLNNAQSTPRTGDMSASVSVVSAREVEPAGGM